MDKGPSLSTKDSARDCVVTILGPATSSDKYFNSDKDQAQYNAHASFTAAGSTIYTLPAGPSQISAQVDATVGAYSMVNGCGGTAPSDYGRAAANACASASGYIVLFVSP
jgi:hypothetical protein